MVGETLQAGLIPFCGSVTIFPKLTWRKSILESDPVRKFRRSLYDERRIRVGRPRLNPVATRRTAANQRSKQQDDFLSVYLSRCHSTRLSQTWRDISIFSQFSSSDVLRTSHPKSRKRSRESSLRLNPKIFLFLASSTRSFSRVIHQTVSSRFSCLITIF